MLSVVSVSDGVTISVTSGHFLICGIIQAFVCIHVGKPKPEEIVLAKVLNEASPTVKTIIQLHR